MTKETAAELLALSQRLSVRHAGLNGTLQGALSRKSQLSNNIALAKGRLALNDEMKGVFEVLQARANERSVGAFERLLTALIEEVIPGEGAVRFIPKFRDGKTWLDIMLEKEGNLEDIWDGNGGALTNIVSAGLRYAALSRTKNRPLMVLDEPDCWIKPSIVPAFIQVLCQVADQINVQTMIISHYDDPEVFVERANVIRLKAGEGGHPEIEVIQPLVNQWTDTHTPGIRQIELYNVRRHIHTVMPCFPGATAIVGDNNLGKSTLVATALRAVAYGESDESIINHNASEARIVIHLENEMRLEWSRARKRARTVVYRLYHKDSDEILREGYPPSRNSVPDWVEQLLNIKRADDMDIQIGNQKLPVFLLNETATRRAQLLSLGRESRYLRTLMQEYERLRTEDSLTSRNGEKELASLALFIQELEKIIPLEMDVDLAGCSAVELNEAEQYAKILDEYVAKLKEQQAKCLQLEQASEVLQNLPILEELTDTRELQRVINLNQQTAFRLQQYVIPSAVSLPEWAEEQKLAQTIQQIRKTETVLDSYQRLGAIPEIELPILLEESALTEKITRIRHSEHLIRQLSGMPSVDVEIPSINEYQELESVILRLKNSEVTHAAHCSQLSELRTQEEKASQELLELKQSLGVCPLCDSAFGMEHTHA